MGEGGRAVGRQNRRRAFRRSQIRIGAPLGAKGLGHIASNTQGLQLTGQAIKILGAQQIGMHRGADLVVDAAGQEPP